MLTSITPLGERGRKAHWVTTVTSFLAASSVAGVALGGAGGLLGTLLDPLGGSVRLGVLAAALGLGTLLDFGIGGVHLPTVPRQVNEEWLQRYRNWVYGAGFGAQLGLGVVTVVSSSTIYLAFLAAALSASPSTGALIGGLFGLLRGAQPLLAGGVRTPDALFSLGSRLHRWREPVRRAVLLGQLVLLGGSLVAILS